MRAVELERPGPLAGQTASKPWYSDRENIALTAALLGVLIVVAAVTYGYYSTPPQSAPRLVFGDLQLRSSSVEVVGVGRTGLVVRLEALVYNPNPFGATLETTNYSVYANGNHVGNGATARAYTLGPEGLQMVVFSVNAGWLGSFGTVGEYIIGLGHVTWSINGTAVVDAEGLNVSAQYRFIVG